MQLDKEHIRYFGDDVLVIQDVAVKILELMGNAYDEKTPEHMSLKNINTEEMNKLVDTAFLLYYLSTIVLDLDDLMSGYIWDVEHTERMSKCVIPKCPIDYKENLPSAFENLKLFEKTQSMKEIVKDLRLTQRRWKKVNLRDL